MPRINNLAFVDPQDGNLQRSECKPDRCHEVLV